MAVHPECGHAPSRPLLVDRVMTMDWNGYEIYRPGVMGPWHTLPRTEARKAFKRLMEAKPGRIAMLHRLSNANGAVFDTTDASIQNVNAWFQANVQPDPDKPGRLLPEWYSVVLDVGLFLGDVIIERCPWLHWEFFTWGKKNISYQKPVIMGFRMPNPRHNFDMERFVVGYGHQIVASRGSISHYGSVVVRGVEIDVDDAVARQTHRDIRTDAFLHWVRLAESEA